MEALFCGIDVGTQGARCVLVTENGRPVARGRAAFPSVKASLPEGWFEQEPGGWLYAVREALGGVLGDAEADAVAAVGVTSTSGTVCALDAGHRVLMPAIMYNDARSEAEAREVQTAARNLTDRLGYRFSPSF
ncbi:MAG: FGGY family carbohydrate kinase, partial [Candidatus Brocadiaceae bacterium]